MASRGIETHVRRCGRCGATVGPDRPDACLGTLPGVIEACCGHGNRRKSYVKFESGLVLRGFDLQHRPNRHGESLP